MPSRGPCLEEHCFSEDSETVAQRDCVVGSDQREGPGEFSCTRAFGAIRSAPDPATLPYWALTAGHRVGQAVAALCAPKSPIMPTMLPPDLEQFLQTEVASGKYVSADEAVVAGVRLLRDRERQRELLRRELDVGLTALERGDVVTKEGESERNAFFEDIVARGHEAKRADAIRRMNELFEQVGGFHSEPRFLREEPYQQSDSGCVLGETLLS